MTNSNPPTNYHLTLLRHGESVGNAENRLQGQADFPLTETGRQQAQALAKRWLAEGLTFDRVIASPLKRSRETAEIIAAPWTCPSNSTRSGWNAITASCLA